MHDEESTNTRVPHHVRSHSRRFLRIISKIISSPRKATSPPPFQFELTKEAASTNFEVLQQHNMDLERVISEADFSSMSYGSELKDPEVLAPLFQHHPRWPRMKHILKNGSEYHESAIPEHIRLGDIRGCLNYGNHKSAQGERAQMLTAKMEKEVIRGWTIPLLLSHLPHIPNAEMSPMGLANQAGINEHGEIVFKDRVTHDMSFEGEASKTSINHRVDESKLAPLQYGFMFSRMVHYIVACRIRFPSKPILVRKDDVKSAYRWQHLRQSLAKRSALEILADFQLFQTGFPNRQKHKTRQPPKEPHALPCIHPPQRPYTTPVPIHNSLTFEKKDHNRKCGMDTGCNTGYTPTHQA